MENPEEEKGEIEVYERLARLESTQNSIKDDITEIKNHVHDINRRVWYILSGILFSIGISILRMLM